MDIAYSSTNVYPVTKIILNEEGVEEVGVAAGSVERVQDFIFAKVKEAPDGRIDKNTDPFIKDVAALSYKYMHLVATMEAIAAGKFPSTDKTSQYVGNSVSARSRLYTPQEAANNVLNEMKKFA